MKAYILNKAPIKAIPDKTLYDA